MGLVEELEKLNDLKQRGIISEDEYELLLEMLDDRNRLSHIYKEEFFNEIHSKLSNYLFVMKKVENILKTHE